LIRGVRTYVWKVSVRRDTPQGHWYCRGISTMDRWSLRGNVHREGKARGKKTS